MSREWSSASALAFRQPTWKPLNPKKSKELSREVSREASRDASSQKCMVLKEFPKLSVSERSRLVFEAFQKHIETKKAFGNYAGTLSLFRRIYLDWLIGMTASLHSLLDTDGLTLDSLTLDNVVLLHGSYFLGTQSHSSDVDLLFLAPPFVNRYQFFHEFFPYLVEGLNKEGQEVTGIDLREAVYAPVLLFFCNQVLYDCQFVPVETKMFGLLTAQQLDISQMSDLHACDVMGLRSLNSLRSLQVMKSVMEKGGKLPIWIRLIQYLNLWMRRKNLCSNSTGFLSSIAIKILAMKVCQLFMNVENVLQLLCHFFETFAVWDWQHAIVSVSVEEKGESQNIMMQRKKGSGYEEDVMVVCLPTHPKLNASKNLTSATLKILIREFNRASFHLSDLIYAPLMSTELVQGFSRFLDRRAYFTIYHHFIHVSFYNSELLEGEGPEGPGLCVSAKKEKMVGIVKHALKSSLKNMDPYLQCGEIYEKNVQDIIRQVSHRELLCLNRLFLGFRWKSTVKWSKRQNLITVVTQLLQSRLEKDLQKNLQKNPALHATFKDALHVEVFYSSSQEPLMQRMKRGERMKRVNKTLKSTEVWQ